METTRRNNRSLHAGWIALGCLSLWFLPLSAAVAVTTETKVIDPDSGVGTDYTSLSAWEAYIDNTPDLTAGGGLIVKALCRSTSGTNDTTAFTFGGMTTSATCYIWVYGTDFPTNGVWDDAKYILENNDDGSTAAIFGEEYIVFERIQVLVTSAGATARSGLSVDGVTGTNKILIDSCIFKGAYSSTGVGNGVMTADAEATAVIHNCIFYGFTVNGCYAFREITAASSGAIGIYECTVSNCYTGLRGNGNTTVANCAIFNTSDDLNGTFAATSYCAIDDADAMTGKVDISPGGTEADDWAAAMPNYASNNFAIGSASSVLYGAGTADPGGADTTNDDIIDTARPQSTNWDIGAFELVVAAPAAGGQLIFVGGDDT